MILEVCDRGALSEERDRRRVDVTYTQPTIARGLTPAGPPLTGATAALGAPGRRC